MKVQITVLVAIAAFCLGVSSSVYTFMGIFADSDFFGVIVGLAMAPIVGIAFATFAVIAIQLWLVRVFSDEVVTSQFWLLGGAQVVLAVLLSAIWFYLRTKAYLAGPPDPAPFFQSWDTQGLIYGVFWLPLVFLGAGVIVAIEREIMVLHYNRQHSRD